jgi:hypothetical protein
MKFYRLSVIAASISLVACASTQKAEVPAPQVVAQSAPQVVAQPVPVPVPAHPYAMAVQPVRQVVSAPDWFVRLPQDTADMMFAAGTATSVDEQMAYNKARMFAEQKLIESMTARVRSLTKSYRADSGDALNERFEQTIQKTASGELIGAQRVDSRVTHDGRTYKVYVLIRYPLGENNILRKERDQARARKESELRAGRAHQELDRTHTEQAVQQEQADQQLREQIGPRAEPAKSADAVNTPQGELRLLDVENEEYRRKRAEALAKPNAVIGQSTLR